MITSPKISISENAFVFIFLSVGKISKEFASFYRNILTSPFLSRPARLKIKNALENASLSKT